MKLYATIEIQANTFPVKYEFDTGFNKLMVDRVLGTSMFYPCDYGFIHGTHAQDGDPLDVIVYSDFSVMAGAVMQIKPIGMLMMEDEKGIDEKVLAIPHSSIDPRSDAIDDFSDIPINDLEKIKHFFEHYKDLDKGKWVKVMEWQNANKAVDTIKKYHKG